LKAPHITGYSILGKPGDVDDVFADNNTNFIKVCLSGLVG